MAIKRAGKPRPVAGNTRPARSAKAAAAKAKKPSGINVKLAMNWLLRIVFLGLEKTPPPAGLASNDPGHFGGGSPNMKLLYALCWYAWAWLFDRASMPVARERMRRILERERECWGQGETTSSSHLQLWIGAIAGALYVAERAEHPEIVSLAVWWLSVLHAIHTVCRLESGRDEKGNDLRDAMWCPGGRGTTKPKHSGGVPLGWNKTTPKLWQVLRANGEGHPIGKPNQYDIGPWFLSRCTAAARSAIREWPASFPPMAGAFHARRFPDGDFYALFESLDGVSDTTLSAGVLDGEPWISEDRDDAMIARYDGRAPELTIDAERADPKWIDGGRHSAATE
jgi:hypothetical protein